MRESPRLHVLFRCMIASFVLASASIGGNAQQPEPACPIDSSPASPIVPSISPVAGYEPAAIPPEMRMAATQPAPPGTPEQRLQALEQLNLELSRRLQDLTNQQQMLLNRLTPPPANGAPLVYYPPGQLGRPLPREADTIGQGEEESRARVDLSRGIRLLSPDG